MPDANLTRRQLMISGVETVYGSDVAPQGSNSYQPIKMIDPFALDIGGEVVEVTGGNLTRGMSRPISTVRPIGVTFRTYVHGLNTGSYTANQKPPIGDLLRACGCFETFVSSDAEGKPVYRYTPAADVGSDMSLTLIAHQDGFEHRFVGARGNVNFIWKAAEPVVADFNFRGLLTVEASTTRAAPTSLPTVIPPRWIDSGSVFMGSHAAVIENANFNTNNQVLEQRASNATSASGIINIWLTTRAPGGSIDPMVTETSTFDFFGAWRSTSGAVLRLQAGLSQGNRFFIVASQAVLKQVAWGDNSGLGIFNIDFQAYERGANDEFLIEFS